jgi:hypothetical protein
MSTNSLTIMRLKSHFNIVSLSSPLPYLQQHPPNSYSLHSSLSAPLSHISNDIDQIRTPFIHLSRLPSPTSLTTHPLNLYSLHSTRSASLSHISNDATISYQTRTPFIHLSQLPSPISPTTHLPNSYSLHSTQ